MTYDPGKKKRITAEDALKHAYFSVSAYLSHDIDYVLGDSILSVSVSAVTLTIIIGNWTKQGKRTIFMKIWAKEKGQLFVI